MASLKPITNVFLVCIFFVLQSRRRSPTLTRDFAFAAICCHCCHKLPFTQFTLNSHIQSWWTVFLHGVCMLHVKLCRKRVTRKRRSVSQ